jgi:hypothetical protein
VHPLYRQLFWVFAELIVDTGSSISLIQPGVCSSEVKPASFAPFGVMGNEREIRGIQEVKFHLENRKFRHGFCVCRLPTDADGIIAMDFLSERNEGMLTSIWKNKS